MAQLQCFLLLLLLAATACVLMAPAANAMNHIVGGSFGWSLPPNKTFYEEWAKPRTFGVGDKLVFMYRAGIYNILQVDEKEFKACTQQHTIDMQYNGPTIIQLNKTGDYYYYCGVGVHCEAGQKLSIKVTNEQGSSGAPFNPEAPAFAPAPGPDRHNSANSINTFHLTSGLVFTLVSMFII